MNREITSSFVPKFKDGTEYELVNLPGKSKLGSGAYAMVKLVKKKDFDEFYALKEVHLIFPTPQKLALDRLEKYF